MGCKEGVVHALLIAYCVPWYLSIQGTSLLSLKPPILDYQPPRFSER